MKVIVIVVSEIIVTKNHTERNNKKKKKKILTETIGDMRYRISPNECFEDFLDSYRLEDIWRKKNPNEKQFTFKQKYPVVHTRLDYWFISSNLEKMAYSCDILTSITPDHSGLKLQLRNLSDNYVFGKSYWKFNNSLCEDKVFVENMFKN